MRCHILDCENEADDDKITWMPAIGAAVCICQYHATLPPAEKCEMIVDVKRARESHFGFLDIFHAALHKVI